MNNNEPTLNRFDEGRKFSLNITIQCPLRIKQLIPTFTNMDMRTFRRGGVIDAIPSHIHDFSLRELLPFIDDLWIRKTCKTMMNNSLIDRIFISKKEVLRIHDFRTEDYKCLVRCTVLVDCEIEYKTFEMQHAKELLKHVETMELSIRTANCLKNLGIEYIHQLVTWTSLDLLKTKNFGRKSLFEIKELLSERGLSLSDERGEQ